MCVCVGVCVCVGGGEYVRYIAEIYRHKHEGELPVYCIKHEDFSCYMCFIS